MSTQVANASPLQINNLQNAALSLNPVDSLGGPAAIYGIPVWSVVSNAPAPAGGTPAAAGPLGMLTPAADGKSAVYVSNGDEAVTITVQMEADPTPGTNTLLQSVVVTILASEALTPGLVATAVSK